VAPIPQVAPVDIVVSVPIPEPKANISFNETPQMFELPEEDMTLRIGEDIELNTLSFDELDAPIDLGIVEL
jgi:hypothetical protein